MLAEQDYKSSQSRGVGMFSLDSGLYFDRDTQLVRQIRTAKHSSHAPFYLYVPEEDQTDIPVFDTGESTFSYSSLWRENRFSGKDRIGDENKLSLGVTNRWIEPNGFERQRFSIGQAIYFEDRTRCRCPASTTATRGEATASVSPYALEYLYRFNRDWRLSRPTSTGTRTAAAPAPAARCSTTSQKTTRTRWSTPATAIAMTPCAFDEAKVRSWGVGGGDYGTPGSRTEYIKDYYKISQHDFSVIWPIVPQWNVNLPLAV